MLKESMFENGYYENVFPEEKKKHHDDDDDKKSHHKKDDDEKHHREKHDDDSPESKSGLEAKEDTVIDWLDSAQELHSVLSYELYPDKAAKGESGEGAARSLFSKKYNGESQGKEYGFKPEEINKLYNLRDDFINDAGLDKA